jgi:hypothetical protein
MNCETRRKPRDTAGFRFNDRKRKTDYGTFDITPNKTRETNSWHHSQEKTGFVLVRIGAVPQREEKFRLKADQWYLDTDGLSAPEDFMFHSAYLNIIGMGISILPTILRELRDHGGRWFHALEAIADVNPVRAEELGSYNKMKEAWIEWGTKNHYL